MDIKPLQDISYGLYVITSSNNKTHAGCIINTLTQITSINPIIAVSLNKDNYTNKIIKEKGKFSLSILSEKADSKLISTFGYLSSKDEDKFKNIEYELIDDIKVVKENICSYLICEVIDIIEVETHDIFIARVKQTEKLSNDTQMTYKYYHEVLKGKAPKNAPTYVKENEKTTGKRYRCKVCGYIYDDEKEEIPFEKLPSDWKCPLCGRPKDMFEEI